MKINELENAVGGLSQTGKMPCPSWSISAKHCRVGSKLAKVQGSICEGCYALKGMYAFRNVQDALERRLACFLADSTTWACNMAELIKRKGLAFFRWFDSGDLQSLEMLEAIVHVALSVPDCVFWLPTKEYGIVSQWIKTNGEFPENLTVRLSAYKRDTAAPTPQALRHLPSSIVTDHAAPLGHPCPSKDRGNKCGDCRACWDRSVPVVSYFWH